MGLICDQYAMAIADPDSVLIRCFTDSDAQVVREIAGRDSSVVPAGALLVAEVGGQVRAVLSLDTGDVVADPFAPSAALVDLLRVRARQLNGAGTRDVAGKLAVRPFRRRPAIPWTREPSPSA
jgi:hypothetical protein